MAARIARIRIRKTTIDAWAMKPTTWGTTWEKFVPFGLDIDTGWGGVIWIGWCWSGQVTVYVDRY